MAEISFGEWLKHQRKASGWTQAELAQQIRYSTSTLKKYEEAQILLHEALDLVQQVGGPEIIAESLELLAAIASAEAMPVDAVRRLGAAESLRASEGVPIMPSQRADYEVTVSTLRPQLGEKEFSEAWAIGSAMAMEQAVAFALGNDDN